MLVHSVYFWLKEGLSEEERAGFRAGLESLGGIPEVQALYVGAPADTPPRPVIESTYTYGLVVILAGMAEHDIYQEHPLHRQFLERFKDDWERIQVYDVV